MRKFLLVMTVLVPLWLTGCAGQDALTIKNMERQKQMWQEDRRADLPQEKIDARNFEFEQALKYERSK